jgi:ribonuclease HI
MTLKPSPRRPSPSLPFAEPERPGGVHIANIDGASRGNPGPASYAVVLRGPDGKTEFAMGKYLGRSTNNVAEYYALITALDSARAQNIARLLVRSDSELLVRQMQGRYRVKSADLLPLHERARKLAREFSYFAIEHVPRERNREADELANQALDRTAHPEGESAAADLPHRARRAERRLRARYADGVLHPLEKLELAEGETVELTIHPTRKSSGS